MYEESDKHLVRKYEGERDHLGDLGIQSEDNIKMGVQLVGCVDVDLIRDKCVWNCSCPPTIEYCVDLNRH
jgi:hypothetical protein